MSLKPIWRHLSLVAFGLSLVVLGGCGPEYPKCETDDHCRESDQGQEEDKLYCMNGLCQQCRADADCGDPGLECNAGVCEEIPGYCTSTSDCPGAEKCRDNQCGPECLETGDCESGLVCEGGQCVEEPECSADADCDAGEVCKEGVCTTESSSGGERSDCSLETVYFGYNSSSLQSEARSVLQANAECIGEGRVLLEGHADQRGTNEYNLALSERRVRTAKKYLQQLGVPRTNLRDVSYGEERPARQCAETGDTESCYQRNRRVEFSFD